MKQQINLFQPAFRRKRPAFSAFAMLWSWALFVLVMAAGWMFATDRERVLEDELSFVQKQEQAATQRLQHLAGALAARSDDGGLRAVLDASIAALALKERLATILNGSTVGDVDGFSRHMESFARQSADGLWLTRVSIAAPDGQTTLEGRARNPQQVPKYLQALSREAPLTGQRFTQFQIERSPDPQEQSIRFSMTSERQERVAQSR